MLTAEPRYGRHVYDGLHDALLSRQSLQALGFLPDNWPHRLQVARIDLPERDPTPAEINKIRGDLVSEFADVFSESTDKLKPMAGPDMDIVLEPDAKSRRVYTARPIPYAYREQIKQQLDDMVAEGIIKPVTEPTDWCHPIVVVDKKNSSEKRLTVDLKSLNSQVKRPARPMATPRDLLPNIGTSKWFTKVDARHGYWQIPLSDAAKPMTTFITPWGRFQYLRNPQGLISAGDEYNRRTDAAFAHLNNFVKVVDDGLVHGQTFREHVADVRNTLLCARENGITFSLKKFVFASHEVDYCGYILNSAGFTVDPAKTAAIRDFPTPSNRTDLRSFLGLVNQCSEFSSRLSAVGTPLRPLLKQTNEFIWDADHDAAFSAVKQELTSPPILAFFQPGGELRLQTDASALNGLGFALWQFQDDKWRLIHCGSRFLSDAETRYAIIELELLAVVWAVHKCKLFLSGMHFTVYTDHRPLIPIVNSYTLDQIENPRLQRLVLKLRQYQLHAVWQKGADNMFADALSRHPVANPVPDEEFGENPAVSSSSIRACLQLSSGSGLQFHQLLAVAQADPEYQSLVTTVRNGFPGYMRFLSPSVKPYWSARHHLTVDRDIVLKGEQIVVPKALRAQVLADLHTAHQGLVRSKSRARQTVYWPNITKDIEQHVRACDTCRLRLPSQPSEPPLNDHAPQLPFESVSADLFQCQGQHFIVYVDRLTGWPCVARLGHSTTSHAVIIALRRWFPDIGVPAVLMTDGGPQFSSRKFAEFCQRWGIDHISSSPTTLKATASAEAGVKAMKTLIVKTTTNGNLDTESFARGLLEVAEYPQRQWQEPGSTSSW